MPARALQLMMGTVSLPAQAPPEIDEDDEDPDPSGLIGRILDHRYEVTGLLGVGGIGRVYRAEHLVLKRPVALKVLLEHYQCVPELQRRFEREAMALAALSHPNIVTITDFVSNKEATFLVMELVEGRDLDDILEDDGPLAPADAFDIMEQLLCCLAYAHEEDVIHRDLKPQNVLVRQLAGGRLHAEVLDFGLAKFMDGSGPSANLTKTGLIVGTPAYMAPEQASGAHADKRADVYAAGIMLFEMLAGKHPFEGFDGSELLRQHLLTPAPSLGSVCPDATVALELEAFLARALAKDGADRYADGEAMLAALQALPKDAFVREGGTDKRVRVARQEAPTVVAASRTAVVAPARPSLASRLRLLLGFVITIAVTAIVVLMLMPDPTPPTTSVGGTGADGTGADGTGADGTGSDDTVSAGGAEGADALGGLTDTDTDADADAAAVDDEDDEVTAADLEDEVDAPLRDEEDEADEPAPPPRESRPAARNPWRGRAPQPLDRVRRRISRGHTITKGHINEVARYRRRNPNDVRATLVLAQAYMARGWLSSALIQYRRAYRRDPSSRGDARMHRDLIRLAGIENIHDDATAAIVEIYGTEAAESLRSAIRREADAGTRARLEDTLARATAG